MDEKLPVVEIARESWRLASRAVVPGLPWLAGLMVSAGAYRLALGSAIGGGSIIALALLAAVFVAGVAYSLQVYRAMLARPVGKFIQLAHANLAAYMAFLFVGVFISFFLAILPGILLEASGRTDLGADTAPATVQAAFMDMLPTAYGAARPCGHAHPCCAFRIGGGGQCGAQSHARHRHSRAVCRRGLGHPVARPVHSRGSWARRDSVAASGAGCE